MRSAGRNAGALVPLSVLLSCCCCGTSCWQEQVFSGFLLKRKSQALSPVECKTPAPHVGPDTELHSFRASRQGALAQCRSLRCLPGEGAAFGYMYATKFSHISPITTQKAVFPSFQARKCWFITSCGAQYICAVLKTLPWQ